MSNFAYALTQGLADAAASGVKSIDLAQKEAAEQRAADRKLREAERLKAIDELYTIRAEERKRQNAMNEGQAINKGATGLLNSTAASNINSQFGSSIDPNNPDSAETLAAIRANPAAAKAYNLQPEDDITKARARAEAARNQGNMSAAKELDTAAENLRKSKSDEDKGKRDERRLDLLEEFQRKQADRQQTLAEATLSHQQRMEKSADARATEAAQREQRSATAKALDGVNADIRSLEKEVSSIDNQEPEKQKVLKNQLQSLRNEAAGYRKALAGAGLPGSEPPEGAKLPGPKAGDVIAGYRFKGGDPKDKTNWEPAGTAASTPAKPKPATSSATPTTTKPKGLLASSEDEGPTTQAETIGRALDAARKALSSVGNPPPGRQADALAAWRADRDAKAARVRALQQQYEEAISAETGGR